MKQVQYVVFISYKYMHMGFFDQILRDVWGYNFLVALVKLPYWLPLAFWPKTLGGGVNLQMVVETLNPTCCNQIYLNFLH